MVFVNYWLSMVDKFYKPLFAPDMNGRKDSGGVLVYKDIDVGGGVVGIQLEVWFDGGGPTHVRGLRQLGPRSVKTQYYVVRSVGADGSISQAHQLATTSTDPQWNIGGKLSRSGPVGGEVSIQRNGATNSTATQDTRTITTPSRAINRLDIVFHASMPGLASLPMATAFG